MEEEEAVAAGDALAEAVVKAAVVDVVEVAVVEANAIICN